MENKETKKMKKTSEGVYQSGIPGITWEKNIDTWRASISVDGRAWALGFDPVKENLIPILQAAKAKKNESVKAFEDWYYNELGRTIREYHPAPLQSDVVGVSYVARSNKWLAQVSIENRKYVLGYYDVQEDAEAARHEAEKIKEKCENTITEDGIIDYTPVYEHLESLRIERQKSRLDARIGTGHGRRAWRRLKKEEHALDELMLKSYKGELLKELKDYKKVSKEGELSGLIGYPTIKPFKGVYHVFVDENLYVGKTTDILHAILLYEVTSSKLNTEYWVQYFEEELNLGLKVPSIDELALELGLSLDRYYELKKLASSFGFSCKKETIGDINIYSRDFRHIQSNKRRQVYAGVAFVMLDGVKVPLKGTNIMLDEGEEAFLIDSIVDNIYNNEDAANALQNEEFWHWYLYESGVFA